MVRGLWAYIIKEYKAQMFCSKKVRPFVTTSWHIVCRCYKLEINLSPRPKTCHFFPCAIPDYRSDKYKKNQITNQKIKDSTVVEISLRHEKTTFELIFSFHRQSVLDNLSL